MEQNFACEIKSAHLIAKLHKSIHL